jgi:hypothetical protein
MTTKIRYIISLVAIAVISLGLSAPAKIQATIAAVDRTVYAIDGSVLGKIPKMGRYKVIARLPDGRLKIRYGNSKIGYIRPIR